MVRKTLFEKSFQPHVLDDEDWRRGNEEFREIYINENFKRINENFEEIYAGGVGGGVIDDEPDPFSFAPITNAALGQLYESEEIIVSGLTASAQVYVTAVNLEYSINGGAYTSVQGTASNGSVVKVRRHASSFAGVQTQGSLTIGGPDNGVTADFIITTDTGLWTPSSEQIIRHFADTDVTSGPVASWQSRGNWPKTAAQAASFNQPTKLAAGGVKCTKGSRQWLQFNGDSRNVLTDRWGVMVVAVDLVNNINVGTFMFGQTDGASTTDSSRHPHYIFRALAGVFSMGIQTSRAPDVGGPVINDTDILPIDGDIATKQLLIWWRRENKIGIRVNGVKSTPHFYGGWRPNSLSSNVSVLGYNTTAANLPADFIIYTQLIGQGELNDGQLDKVEGWAAHAYGITLPPGHPYADAAPTNDPDPNDNPAHYEFDEEAWTDWTTLIGVATDLTSAKYDHRGEAEVAQSGNEVVFFDDFKADSLVSNYRGPKGSVWMVPLNPPIGVNQQAGAPDKNAINYIIDPSGDGTVTFRLEDSANGAWNSGSMQSVNANGVGRAWGGHRVIEARMKFPLIPGTKPDFFPAKWGYNEESYFWQTRPRVEWDFAEYDGLNGAYLNQTLHLHKGNIPYDEEEFVPPNTFKKLIAYPLTVANGFTPQIDIYDGEYHLWKTWMETDFTYTSVDGKEVVRVPTIPEFLLRAPLLFDWAYRATAGHLAVAGQVYDMVIDYVRVSKKTTELATFPAAFSARPTLSGTPAVPNVLTLDPKITSTQLQVHWYRSGMPVVALTDALTYPLAEADIGFKIRASCRALEKVDQPEAWTAETATIA